MSGPSERCGWVLDPGFGATEPFVPCPGCENCAPDQEARAERGVELIASERKRQIAEEGWIPVHDDTHGRGQLAEAAVAYIDRDPSRWPFGYQADGPDGHGSTGGPWVQGRPKLTPNDRVRELVKAGALIAAEIDRLCRFAPDQERCGGSGEIHPDYRANPRPYTCPGCEDCLDPPVPEPEGKPEQGEERWLLRGIGSFGEPDYNSCEGPPLQPEETVEVVRASALTAERKARDEDATDYEEMRVRAERAEAERDIADEALTTAVDERDQVRRNWEVSKARVVTRAEAAEAREQALRDKLGEHVEWLEQHAVDADAKARAGRPVPPCSAMEERAATLHAAARHARSLLSEEGEDA